MKLKKTVSRPLYISRLIELEGDTATVRVLIGIRGCGKSTVIREYIASLEERGVPSDHIVYMELENTFGNFFEKPEDAIAYLDHNMPTDGKRTYVFLDGVGRPDSWTEICNHVLTNYNAEVTVVTSSGKAIGTGREMPKRYVMILVRPLLFERFLRTYPPEKQIDIPSRFREYMLFGGLPTVDVNLSEEEKKKRLKELIEDIRIHDLLPRYNDLNFDRIQLVLVSIFRHQGEPVNTEQIAAETGLTVREVTRYVEIVRQERLAVYINAYDLKHRRPLHELGQIFYSVDLGLLNALQGSYPDPPDCFRYQNAV
ncbi:MAG: AAA family ATPase [Candidatus Methanomethylophilus sp.]|nr:AAA family ATPase [Methanomethylophilus sp.]MDD4668913.1 AAA family ATPase [Methanomethylophilus sp.]